MPQFFARSANTLFRVILISGVGSVLAVAAVGYLIVGSPYETMQNVPREQPVAFSHEHHVGGLGHRLPVLPYHGRVFVVRQYPCRPKSA